MSAYYNEIDPYAAQWLRNLIAAGHIAPGHVDERDIRDIEPRDLDGFVQCHFFAGIGVWSHALRRAGWPDHWPVWTGSCPCQPFSAAGLAAGFDDERHLWPSWHHLIRLRRPERIFGEQVASKVALAWLDLVSADMEGENYSFGAVDLCAAGVGAPHIRQRLWWVADAKVRSLGSLNGKSGSSLRSQEPARRCDLSGELGDAGTPGLPTRERAAVVGAGRRDEGRAAQQSGRASGRLEHMPGDGREQRGSESSGGGTLVRCGSGGMGDTELLRRNSGLPTVARAAESAWGSHGPIPDRSGDIQRPGPTNGFWRDPDWLRCRDGKWRPVEPGTFPLAHGAPARVGRLRAYGNAIPADAATEVIGSYMDISGLYDRLNIEILA